jgi:5'-3' exonuclease
MKIHLVDGTYELFRAYYGAPSALDPKGREVGATRGLLRSLLSLLRQDDVTHVACAFDHVIESFRNELFAGYKTGEGIEPALRAQFDLAERAAAALGIVVWSMVEFEADDALATGAARWRDSQDVEQIVICSPDKDLAQCVSGRRVVCHDRRRQKLLDEAGVVEKFGVSPESMPDWLGLVGDAADGIPGIPGWGPKSSALLLARYRHIENIPEEAILWGVKVQGAKRLAASLRGHREEARLYRLLATLRTDVPLTEELGSLRWKGARKDQLEALCRELGEKNLLNQVHGWLD